MFFILIPQEVDLSTNSYTLHLSRLLYSGAYGQLLQLENGRSQNAPVDIETLHSRGNAVRVQRPLARASSWEVV